MKEATNSVDKWAWQQLAADWTKLARSTGLNQEWQTLHAPPSRKRKMPRLAKRDGAVWGETYDVGLRFIAVIGDNGRSGVTRYKLLSNEQLRRCFGFQAH